MTYYDSRRLRASGHTHIIYDGVDLNDYFEVTAFGFNVLPEIGAVSASIPGKAGQHYYGRTVGVRTGTIRLTAIADDNDPLSVLERWTELAPLINKSEPRPLYLDSDKYINAMLTGETPLEFLGERGTVELTFTAFDPYFHGKIHEVPLKAGANPFRVLSPCEVYPIVTVTGASAPLQVRNNVTYDQVRIPTVGNKEIKIDMENCKVFSGSDYLPVDLQTTDFFSLKPGELAEIYLSSGSGTLTYEELS